MDIVALVKRFDVEGSIHSIKEYGGGYINSTFLVTTKNGEIKKKYIFQRINHKAFKDVEGLMENIRRVTVYNRAKVLESGGDPDRESLSLILTKDDKTYIYDEESDGYYRMYKFIDDAIAYQSVKKPETFYNCAVAFGRFANLLAGFEASSLNITIPDFHNTVKRYENFERAVKEDKCGRVKDAEREIEYARAKKAYAPKIVSLMDKGLIPIRVTHNDTRINNVMLDIVTGEAVAVIDLDTVMAGSLLFDFGDAIRSGCNPRGDDEEKLYKVVFDIDLFEQYVKGYLQEVRQSITATEVDNLALSALVITYELGIRFLSDYLDGDVYFRTSREGQNLVRARVQFKMLSDMEERFDEMQKIVQKYR